MNARRRIPFPAASLPYNLKKPRPPLPPPSLDEDELLHQPVQAVRVGRNKFEVNLSGGIRFFMGPSPGGPPAGVEPLVILLPAAVNPDPRGARHPFPAAGSGGDSADHREFGDEDRVGKRVEIGWEGVTGKGGQGSAKGSRW